MMVGFFAGCETLQTTYRGELFDLFKFYILFCFAKLTPAVHKKFPYQIEFAYILETLCMYSTLTQLSMNQLNMSRLWLACYTRLPTYLSVPCWSISLVMSFSSSLYSFVG